MIIIKIYKIYLDRVATSISGSFSFTYRNFFNQTFTIKYKIIFYLLR